MGNEDVFNSSIRIKHPPEQEDRVEDDTNYDLDEELEEE